MDVSWKGDAAKSSILLSDFPWNKPSSYWGTSMKCHSCPILTTMNVGKTMPSTIRTIPIFTINSLCGMVEVLVYDPQLTNVWFKHSQQFIIWNIFAANPTFARTNPTKDMTYPLTCSNPFVGASVFYIPKPKTWNSRKPKNLKLRSKP